MQKIDVRVLIEKHNHHKGYTPIPFNTLWGMFKDSLKRVDNPLMDDEAWGRIMQTPEYQKAMDKVDRTWLDCQSGKSGIEDFKSVLEQWKGVIKSWQN